jgi:hypothetical protein
MAVTVRKRPEGHKISPQALEASISDSGGDALVTALYHGLGTGDYVYIDSDIDEYNGFWYVTTIDSDQFKISEYATAEFVEYFQDLDIEYYQTAEHDWNSAFLPIVYKCSNNRWPVNSFDAVRTISSFADDNGYTRVVTSANLKLSAAALEFVIISGSSDSDLNGVWQMVEVVGSLNYTLDLPYNASNDLVGANIQYYYNNYQVRVKIYAGLPTSHPWESKKPYEEVGELSLTPDENGVVMFSVADYIKNKLAIKNNTTIFSYPLNLDAFTAFYIAVAESYDSSDGYTLITTQSDFEDDTFEGYSIAGKLPFKNTYSGDYADYVYTDNNPANWLTILDRLVAVEDKYFDISFIKNVVGAFSVVINKYVSDYLTATETVDYADNGIGVYRIPIEVDSVYDSFCVYVIRDADTGFTPAEMDPIDTWTNVDTGGETWVLNGSVPEIDFDGLGLGVFSDDWRTAYAFEEGRTYSFDYSFKGANTAGIFWIEIIDSAFSVLLSLSIPTNPEAQSGNYSFVAPAGATGINIWYDNPASCGGECLTRIISFTNETEGDPVSPAYTITDEICMDIIESCEAQGGVVPTDIRLLEDGSYRLLE